MKPRLVATLDALAVVLFVVLGRRSHDEGNLVWGTVTTAAPFLLALAAGWAAGWKLRIEPRSVRFGALVWGVTLVVGMLLRNIVFGRGTAVSFVVVATVFLGLFLVGWRLVASWVARRRTAGVAPTT